MSASLHIFTHPGITWLAQNSLNKHHWLLRHFALVSQPLVARAQQTYKHQDCRSIEEGHVGVKRSGDHLLRVWNTQSHLPPGDNPEHLLCRFNCFRNSIPFPLEKQKKSKNETKISHQLERMKWQRQVVFCREHSVIDRHWTAILEPWDALGSNALESPRSCDTGEKAFWALYLVLKYVENPSTPHASSLYDDFYK